MATRAIDTITVNNQASEVEKKIRIGSLTNRHFELIIFPTEQCNFRCTYCYEDFAIGNMRQPVVDGICNLLSARAGALDKLHLSYFGGEPLLNMRAVRQISRHALHLQDRFGFALSSGMTTNAFLLDAERLEEMVDLGCSSYQISLDGWGDAHDQTRIQRNQKGSFERIWSNLLEARQTKLDFHYLLRVHMHPANIQSLFTLVTNINEKLDDSRFEIMFKKVGEWGGKNADHPVVFEDGSLDLKEACERLASMAARVSNAGVDEFGGSTADAGQEPGTLTQMPYVCYASRANSLAVRSNGRINKCTVALTNPKNDIGHINPDGTLKIDGAKLAPWLGGVGTLDEQYLGCPASKVLRA